MGDALSVPFIVSCPGMDTGCPQYVILEAEKSGFINVGAILFLAFINGGLTKLQTGQKAKLV